MSARYERKMAIVVEAQNFCKAHGVSFWMTTLWQMKIGDINYYPTTRRLYVDGIKECQYGVDLNELLEWIRGKKKT